MNEKIYPTMVIRRQAETIELLEKENERLNKGLEYAKRIEKDYKTKFDKAIEYIRYNATSNYFDEEKNMFRREIDLLEILGGSDKE